MNRIQEQEERDFNPRSDLENLFEQSRRETELNDPRIAEALSRGKHVVVTSVPVYCPWTDAALGDKTYFESEHDSRAEAQREVVRRYEDDTVLALEDNEIDLFIKSPAGSTKPVEHVPVENEDDDVPF